MSTPYLDGIVAAYVAARENPEADQAEIMAAVYRATPGWPHLAEAIAREVYEHEDHPLLTLLRVCHYVSFVERSTADVDVNRAYIAMIEPRSQVPV